LSKRREAAKRFFSRATKQHGAPKVITLDGYAAWHRAVTNLKAARTLPRRVRVRSCKYLNNVVEQDHRRSSSESDRSLSTLLQVDQTTVRRVLTNAFVATLEMHGKGTFLDPRPYDVGYMA
jgi:arabinogalactan endo-1,4-beta-galactosidase